MLGKEEWEGIEMLVYPPSPTETALVDEPFSE